jgi:hypothetical protein
VTAPTPTTPDALDRLLARLLVAALRRRRAGGDGRRRRDRTSRLTPPQRILGLVRLCVAVEAEARP